MGAPTLDGLGRSAAAITPEEYLELDSIVPRTTLLAALMLAIGRSGYEDGVVIRRVSRYEGSGTQVVPICCADGIISTRLDEACSSAARDTILRVERQTSFRAFAK